MSAITGRNNSRVDGDPALVDAQWLARRCEMGGRRGLAETMAALIRSGDLIPGARLPTVREIARLMGCSQGTVATAWTSLRDKGFVETRRRGGTFVTGASDYDTELARPDKPALTWNLASTASDPQFHPPLQDALLAGLSVPNLHSAQRQHVIDPLIAVVAPTWPFECEAWTTAGGASEGIVLAILAAAEAGGTIAVETPTNPRTVQILSTLGMTVIPVRWDGDGPVVADLIAALENGAKAFLYQPRAHFPLAKRIASQRRVALAAVLRQHEDVVVIEDDGFGPLAGPDSITLGDLLPTRVLLARAYCKAYGVDLRVSVLGGPARLIDRARRHRSYGASVTSRILQGAIVALIENRSVDSLVARARQHYARRRKLMVEALSRNGFIVDSDEGFSIWLRVPDATAALVRLNAQGIILAPGNGCTFGGDNEHLCLATARLPEVPRQIERLARQIAEAARDHGADEFG